MELIGIFTPKVMTNQQGKGGKNNTVPQKPKPVFSFVNLAIEIFKITKTCTELHKIVSKIINTVNKLVHCNDCQLYLWASSSHHTVLICIV